MKKELLLIIALVPLTFTSKGQISLTASMLPAPGTTIYNWDANVPYPAFTFNKTGTSNTWDFTTATPVPNADDTIYYIDPATAPGGSAFPTAQVATYERGDKKETFIKADANFGYALGIGGDVFGSGTILGVPFTHPVEGISFPYTYGSKVMSTGYMHYKTTGAAIGQPSIDSVLLSNAITLNHEVIASGNIILPSGTYPALLEIQRTTTIDSSKIKSASTSNQWAFIPGNPKTKIDSVYYWYTTMSLEPAAHVIYTNGTISDVTYFKSMVTGIEENRKAINLSLYPNPVKEVLVLNAENNVVKQVSIVDITGAEVMKSESNETRVNVQGLAPGIYFVKIYVGDNASQYQKFIKM